MVGVEQIAYLTNLVLEVDGINLCIMKFAVCMESAQNRSVPWGACLVTSPVACAS